MRGNSFQDYETDEFREFRRFYKPSTDFFDREEERKNLIRYLKSDSKRIYVLQGPRNCGKSRLINETLKDLNQFVPIKVNLRASMRANDPNDTLLAFLIQAFNMHLTLLDQLQKTYKEKPRSSDWEFGINIQGLEPLIPAIESYIKVTPKLNPNEIDSAKFRRVFQKAIDNYKESIFQSSKVNLVLFIDEFNNVKREEDQKFVQTFLGDIVKKSKEEGKLSVLLGTTDSFLINYLSSEGYLNDGSYTELYLGWLSKEETFRYLNYRSVPEEFHEMIYEFHGGDIWQIQSLLNFIPRPIEKSDILEWIDSILANQIPLVSASNMDLDAKETEVLNEIYRKLLKENYVFRAELNEKFGKNIITDLLRRNLFYTQRGFGLKKGERISQEEIITLNAPSHRFAVEKYLLRLDKLK